MSPLPAMDRGPLRRALVLAVALLAAAATFAAAARPAAAATKTVRVMEMLPGSTWTVHDDETWGADEELTWAFTSQQFVPPTFDDATRWYANSTSRCHGAEVRAETKMTGYIRDDKTVRLTIMTDLYEGASCSTTDLDGAKTVSVELAPGQTKWVDVRVDNTDEGGDWSAQHIGFKYVTKTVAA